ncbi:MAG: hypothetical protein FWH38_00740 [Treponema sp.]|nr:hypothetical protein [Treponema sp.]
MQTVNYLFSGEGTTRVNFTLGSLGLNPSPGDNDDYQRVKNLIIGEKQFSLLKICAKYIGFSARWKDVIRTFQVPAHETPQGFRIETTLEDENLLKLDLVRDISYDKNGLKRPTNIIFSADSANPYEVAPIAPLLGNLTCNPGIVYDLFINNPKANTGGKFKARDEVITEIGRILGPGCDISVELNNPFEKNFDKILKECEIFKKILSEYRLVIKVPHTGPVNNGNVHELLEGDKRFSIPFDQGTTADALWGHNLALKLRENGYRINYTLMFEPYQTSMALQAKPYFINSFVRHRFKQSEAIKQFLDMYDLTGESKYILDLRNYFLANDYLAKGDEGHDLFDVLKLGRDIIRYRNVETSYGDDGLDGVRHNLRMLRQCNLPDTRLIICSMEGEYNYPDIDRLMADPEYADIIDRIIITAEPRYLARFTSTSQVVSYQRRFMNAASGQK